MAPLQPPLRPEDVEDLGEIEIGVETEPGTLMETGGQKDDMILELTVQVKILRHELKVQELHNQCLIRRDEADGNVFAKPYQQKIQELEEKLKELEAAVSQKSKSFEARGQSQGMLIDALSRASKEFIESKAQLLSSLQKKIEETSAAHEKNLQEAKNNRKQYAQALGEIQVAVEHMLSEVTDVESVENE